MALENVFGSPPPVVGLLFNHTMNKHGEKQRNGILDDHSDGEKEEGEIEDGEIVDSQEDEEDGGGGGGGVRTSIGTRLSAIAGTNIFATKTPINDVVQNSLDWGTAQVGNDGGGNCMPNKKNKKKKKKKKKRPLGQLLEEELGSTVVSTEDLENGTSLPKTKKQRKFYVDHDRVENDDSYFIPNEPPFPRGRRGSDSPPPGYDSPSYRRSSPQPPPLRRSRSPPGLYDSPYESEEEYDGTPPIPPPNSVANGRYDDGGGDPLGRMMGNGTGKNRRKGRRGENGRQGGGGRKKRKQRPPAAICKFYQDGKCSKGDECTFKHDGSIPKKMELCKFYLNGFCAKAEGCVYLHNEYPCKFFHTGVKCYSADKCKFSHEPLTDETRLLLEKCLDKDEEEMLADVPQKHFRPSLLGTPSNRFSKDGGGQVHEALKGIPSLFDIEVSIPPSLQQQQQQHQTMSPPSYQQHEEEHQMGPSAPFYAETMSGSPPPKMPMKTPLLPLPFCTNRSQRSHGYDDQDNDMYQSAMGMMDVDDRIGGMDCNPYLSNGESMDTDLRTMLPQNCGDNDREMFNPRPWHITAVDVDMRGRRMDNDEDWDGKKDQQSDQEKGRCSSDSESESGVKKTDSSGPIQIPVHLPKKQRELFLRIQQQQRAAGSIRKDIKRKMDGDEDEGETEEMEGDEHNDDDDDDDDILTRFKIETEEEKRDEEEDEEEEEEDDEENEYDTNVTTETKTEREEMEMDEQQEKEKWYSSDDDDEDEDQPLTAVLKKLQQQPIQKVVEPQKPLAPFSTTSIFDIAKMIQSITNQGSSTTVNNNKNTVELTSTDTRSQVTKVATVSRDPRSQKQESRDPRAPRNIDTHEHIHKSFFRDPRIQQSTASIQKDLKPPISNVKKEQKVPILSSPDRTEGTNPNSLLYRVHTIVTSRPDYAYIASTSNMDPRLVATDPRLKRHVADDPRFSRYIVNSPGHSSSDDDRKKKTIEISSSSIRNLTKLKSGGVMKPVTNARPGLHRLGVVTMPGPLRDEPHSKGSGGGGSILDNKKGEEEEYSLSDLDDIVKKPSVFPRRLSRDGSIELIRSPVRESGIVKEQIGKRSKLAKVEECDTTRESFTPPLIEYKVQEPPAKLKGGSYKRKSSMDYASPLGGYDNEDGMERSEGYGGYQKRPQSGHNPVARNKSNTVSTESLVIIPKDLLEPPRSSPPPIGITSLSTPMESSSSSDEAPLVIDNASLKDIFKTIDPTASPFC